MDLSDISTNLDCIHTTVHKVSPCIRVKSINAGYTFPHRTPFISDEGSTVHEISMSRVCYRENGFTQFNT